MLLSASSLTNPYSKAWNRLETPVEAASATMLNHSADKKVLQCCAMALNNLCLESNRNKAFNFCHR